MREPHLCLGKGGPGWLWQDATVTVDIPKEHGGHIVSHDDVHTACRVGMGIEA